MSSVNPLVNARNIASSLIWTEISTLWEQLLTVGKHLHVPWFWQSCLNDTVICDDEPKVGIFSDPVRKDISVPGLTSFFSKNLKESKIWKTLVNSNWLITVNFLLAIFHCVQSKEMRKNIKEINLVKIECQRPSTLLELTLPADRCLSHILIVLVTSSNKGFCTKNYLQSSIAISNRTTWRATNFKYLKRISDFCNC